MVQSFNLIDQPWIKAQTSDDSVKLLSLTDCFKQVKDIKALAGDSKSQDLCILRLLLAIMTRTYNDTQEPLETWHKLYKAQDFEAVLAYLNQQHDNFDFFGNKPFMQVPQDIFVKYASQSPKVSNPKQLKTKGLVAISQLNRNINQSNNGFSTMSFISNINKDKLALPNLIRWTIAYQNFTGVSDKIKLTNASTDAGELLSIKPVYLKGKTLAETLMLNLILNKPSGKPCWEYSNEDYIKHRLANLRPESIAELYTLQSRMLFIENQDNQLVIHAATYPKVDRTNLSAEPMTTWHWHQGDKKSREGLVPDSLSLNSNSYQKSMWRNFGDYINDDINKLRMPGIMEWIHTLEGEDYLPLDFELPLQTTYCVRDKTATSQVPVLEINDGLVLPIKLAFENRMQIQDLINCLQLVASKGLYYFGSQLNNLYGADFRTNLLCNYYYHLNLQFKPWLTDLKQTDLTKAIEDEKQYAYQLTKDVMQTAIKDLQFKADQNGKTVFDYKAIALSKIRKELRIC